MAGSRRLGLDRVSLRDRQEDDDGQDREQEDHAGDRRAEAEPAVGARLREVVADRCAERSRQDVGDPEREDRVQREPHVGHVHRRDQRAEQQRRLPVPDGEPLRGQVARRRARART